MIGLIVTALVAALILGLAYYQSYLDKQKWKRITAPKKPVATTKFQRQESAAVPVESQRTEV